MTLSSPLTDVKGVGSELAKKFAVLGVTTVQDLIYYYPRRYDDYSNVQPIGKIKSLSRQKAVMLGEDFM
jgi:ATP-dependent DNA helicase RecG